MDSETVKMSPKRAAATTARARIHRVTRPRAARIAATMGTPNAAVAVPMAARWQGYVRRLGFVPLRNTNHRMARIPLTRELAKIHLPRNPCERRDRLRCPCGWVIMLRTSWFGVRIGREIVEGRRGARLIFVRTVMSIPLQNAS
jgi:hypothetical protein